MPISKGVISTVLEDAPSAFSAQAPSPGAVSVVILTYNSMKTLGACLASVVPSLRAGDEVILVDNGSTDGTVDFLRQLKGAEPTIRTIVNGQNLGFSAGSNVGLMSAKGQYLALLNPDTVVTREWIPRMVRYFAHEQVGAVGPVVDNVGGHQKVEDHVPAGLEGNYDFEGIARVLGQANDGNGLLTPMLIGCCIMFSRKALSETGLLDPQLFLGCDDLDMSWRLQLAGYRLVVARDAFIHHECHVSFDTLPESTTTPLVQESWNHLGRKLIAHYGMGKVPPPQLLWNIEWFDASPEIWEGATLPYDAESAGKITATAPKTVGVFAAKIASDLGSPRLVEIGSQVRLVVPKIEANHVSLDRSQIAASREVLRDAVVVCDGQDLSQAELRILCDSARTVVVSEPLSAQGPSGDCPVLFRGEMPTFRDRGGARSKVWVLDRSVESLRGPVPDAFRPVSLMTTFNDADVIDQVIDHTLAQGMRIAILDNWSTDGTYEKLLNRRDELEVLERFPAEGPSQTFDSYAILVRQEEMAQAFAGQWVTIQASDELRVSPWPDVTMRQGLYFAQSSGATCVELTILDFRPVDNAYEAGCDLESTFRYCEFGKHPSSLIQQKTWLQPAERVRIAESGGHAVFFAGKRVFPYKFLLKHYSIRSQAHGERKVFGMRQTRWNEEERQKYGWHTHYDGLQPGHSFLADRRKLLEFDVPRFYEQALVERLTGIGTIRGIDWTTPLHPDQWK